MTTPSPAAPPPHGHGPSIAQEDVAPAQVDSATIVVAGLVVWAVALVVTLVVPSLHSGARDWWPWTCVTGLALGLAGLVYILRGRGNAAGARRGE